MSVAQVPISRRFLNDFPRIFCPAAAAHRRPGFVSSNELRRVVKQHGGELSARDVEALTAQVGVAAHVRLLPSLCSRLSAAAWHLHACVRVLTVFVFPRSLQ